jgi:Fe-S-cluster-containing dehydrogenase component
MLKALKIEPELCTGCLQCELACSYENEGVFNPAKSRIKVFAFHEQGRTSPPIPVPSAPRRGACTPARWRQLSTIP